MNKPEQFGSTGQTGRCVPPPRASAAMLKRAGQGYALLEVLVSILVLSFGLLAVAGLQLSSLQSMHQSRLQSVAVQFGRDMAELMEGQRQIALRLDDNPFLFDSSANPPDLALAQSPCEPSFCQTPEQHARWHLAEWFARIRAAESGVAHARVVICRDNSPFDSQGMPRWPCSGAGESIVLKMGWPALLKGNAQPDANQRPIVILRAISGVAS